MKNLFTGVITSSIVAASVLSLSTLDANAASLTCSTSDVTAGGVNATDCYGSNEGNDTGNKSTFIDELNGGLFGDYTWQLADKSDSVSSIAGITLDMTGAGGNNGTWSIDGLDDSSPFVISLKAGDNYSAYFFDAGSAVSGLWDTIGTSLNGSGKAGKQISHISVFVASNQFTESPDSQEVPEPGTLVGLLALGSVVFGKKMIRKS